MVVVFLRKLTKICSLWNRTRKELLFIAALVILVLHYAFLNNSLSIERSELIVNELPGVRWPHLTGNVACEMPKLDPLAEEIAKFERLPVAIICGGEDWMKCYHSKCNQTDDVQEKFSSITCEFRDILLNTRNFSNFTLGPAKRLGFNETYDLIKSDYVNVACSGINITDGMAANWSGVVMALRATPNPPVVTARITNFNVMVLVFDTLSANGFQRLMPASFKAVKEDLRATILRGYSTIGGGTASALLPILTGKSEVELMDAKKDHPHILDSVQFLYRKLKERGYRTGFFQDVPSKGTTLDSLGFRDPPADHLFHKSVLEDGKDVTHCIGDTPGYKLILNITEQFMDLDGNRFGLTFMADLTQSDFGMVQSADDDTAALLLALQRHAADTLLVIMSDHGPRNKRVRDTWQGKLEERLPLMALALPRDLMRKRPRAAASLAENSGVLTTPYDLHATLLDVFGMANENGVTRGRSLLEPISKNRTCSDVGVEPHWCICLTWDHVAPSDPMFQRTADKLVQYINSLLTEAGRKCAPRNLTSIAWVMRQIMPSGGLSASIRDASSQENNPNYQIKVELTPDKATYEATMLYIVREDRFVIRARHISRTNMDADESLCIADTHPHLGTFCHCQY